MNEELWDALIKRIEELEEKEALDDPQNFIKKQREIINDLRHKNEALIEQLYTEVITFE